MGSEVILERKGLNDAYRKHGADELLSFATLGAFISQVRQSITDPAEIWEDRNGDRKFRRIYVLWPEVLSGEALDWRTARFGFITIVNPDGSFVTAFPATQPYITFEANRYAGGLFEFPVKDSNPPR